MSKIIRLTESELKKYIKKILSEQDYYNDPEREMQDKIFTPQPQAQPVQKGERFVPYEKKGPALPTTSIKDEDAKTIIAGIEKAKKSANFLQFIKTYGHTSKESWDAATAGGYAPYASPQLKAQAQKAGYFPYTNMADKRADYARKGIGPAKRPVPQQKQPMQKPKPVPPMGQKPVPPIRKTNI